MCLRESAISENGNFPYGKLAFFKYSRVGNVWCLSCLLARSKKAYGTCGGVVWGALGALLGILGWFLGGSWKVLGGFLAGSWGVLGVSGRLLIFSCWLLKGFGGTWGVLGGSW